jgi:hypothetical protein
MLVSASYAFRLVKPDNVAIIIHGVSVSFLEIRVGLVAIPDTPPISARHHPVFCIARQLQLEARIRRFGEEVSVFDHVRRPLKADLPFDIPNSCTMVMSGRLSQPLRPCPGARQRLAE